MRLKEREKEREREQGVFIEIGQCVDGHVSKMPVKIVQNLVNQRIQSDSNNLNNISVLSANDTRDILILDHIGIGRTR